MNDRNDIELEKEPMTEALARYVEEHSDPEPEELYRLGREAWLHLLNPQMTSGHVQGRLLKMLVRMARPRRVLELGTYAAYSTLAMAEGLDDGAELHTIEISDELEDFIRRQLSLSPHGHKVTPHFGDAAEVLPRLGGETFDFVFIDADKRQYDEYYRMVLPMVRPGGFIVADNTLWYGHVADPARRDAQTAGVRRFNDLVAADHSVEKVMLPLRDGLTLIYKKT